MVFSAACATPERPNRITASWRSALETILASLVPAAGGRPIGWNVGV
jgi:hypothetical protein